MPNRLVSASLQENNEQLNIRTTTLRDFLFILGAKNIYDSEMSGMSSDEEDQLNELLLGHDDDLDYDPDYIPLATA